MKAKLNPILVELSGKIEGMVFRRTASGQIVVAKSPDMSEVEWSKAQVNQRSRFQAANAYARAAMADPAASLYYTAAGEKAGRQPYRVAMSDYFAGNNRLIKKN